MDTNVIYCGDNLEVLSKYISDESVDLIYIDPPFNSNRNYEVFWGEAQERRAFEDCFGDAQHYLEWMRPRIRELHRVLRPTGSFYYHCDWHVSHYIKVELDHVFGFNSFRNEIIWHYTGGGRSKTHFSHKHDVLFWYSKGGKHTFNIDAVRQPYKETSGYAKGGIVSKAGKLYMPHPKGTPVDDVWDIPIINPLAKERLGYPTQKPLALLERITLACSNREDVVLDAFCGSGTTLEAASKHGRRWVGIDLSSTACRVVAQRLEDRLGLKEGVDFQLVKLEGSK